jgi:glycosyltransferase involved in cell wall biosynthesis
MRSLAPYRILMFASAFAPFTNPEAIVNSKLALAFLEAGWRIDVISRSLTDIFAYNFGSEWTQPWLPLKDHTHEITYEVGGKLHRVTDILSSTFTTKYPIEGCRWARRAYDLALKLHKERNYEIILSRSSPDTSHLPGLVMAKMTNLPWITNWNDPSGDKHLPPLGKGANAKLGFFQERFLDEVAQRTSWLTFPSDRMRYYICKQLGNGILEKSSTIPHIAMKLSPKQRENKSGLFSICYAGNLYSGRSPETFFQGVVEFLKMKGAQKRFKFIIIGLENVGIKKLAESYGLESNIELKGPLTYKDTLYYCAESEVLLVIEAPYEDGIYLPSKFVDYVQTGRPILAVSPINGTLHDIISAHGGGIAVNCLSSKEIANALCELYSRWEVNSLDMDYSSDRLYYLFAPERIIESYEEIFKGQSATFARN